MKNLMDDYRNNHVIITKGHYQNIYRNVSFSDSTHNCDGLLFTDHTIYDAHRYEGFKLGVLLEVNEIAEQLKYQNIHHKNIYNDINNPEILDQFYKVFTYDRSLLECNDKFSFYPFGGCWIKEEERKIYEKSKSVSIISSDKKHTQGHFLRHDAVKYFGKYLDGVFGTGYQYIPTKMIGLQEYKYSIVIENVCRDYFFTEKIIDCFVTGTIPIYWGCPSIGDFFNPNGILSFGNIRELHAILTNLKKDDYNNKIEYVKENYELAKQYIERIF